jgi:UPF0755 protein
MSFRKQHALIILLIFVLCIPAWFVFVWHRVLYAPMLLRSGATSIKVYPGNTIHDLANNLYQKGMILHPHVLIFVARIGGKAKKLHFGEYSLNPGMSASTLLANIVDLNGLVKHQITFVEGWTFTQMLETLKKNKNIFYQSQGKSDSAIMASLGHPNQHPEGRFMPDTYTFIWGNSDVDLLRHAYERMQYYLADQWKKRAAGLPYKNIYDALIVASLIEKETFVPEEKPVIASVILHRLKKKMRLQVDPTVLYGLKKPYGTRITRRDLQSKTPYNTYRIKGLPPTPIDMPSKGSIYAALHPAKTSYLFYVATGDGRHVFSQHYRQHRQAVKKFRAWRSKQLEAQSG